MLFLRLRHVKVFCSAHQLLIPLRQFVKNSKTLFRRPSNQIHKLTSWKSHNYFFILISLPSTGLLVIFCLSFSTSAFVRKMKIRKSTSSLLFHDTCIYFFGTFAPSSSKWISNKFLTNLWGCNFSTSFAGEYILLDKICNSYQSIPTIFLSRLR